MNHYYVEYARAKRAIWIALILLGLFFLATVVLRLSVHDDHWDTELQNSPTAHVTKTQLPDGSTRIVVDDPARQTHAVIVRHRNGAFDMDVVEPAAGTRHHAHLIMGDSRLNQSVKDGKRHTTLHYVRGWPKYDLGVLFMVTIPMGLIVASMLGGTLAKENDGHLELAWTKPISRVEYALGSIGVDAAAIVLSQLLTIAVTLLATLLFFVPRFQYEAQMGWHILFAFACPIAWYALVTAASASLKRGPGMVIGLGWVAAILIPSLAGALEGAASVSAIAAWFYAIFHGLSYIDPISYLAFHRHTPALMPLAASVGVLCALIAGYIALAVAQWHRVEA